MKKTKQKLFACLRCKQDVFRETKKTRIDLKICGGCYGKTNNYAPRRASNEDTTKPRIILLIPHDDVLAGLKFYRSLCDKVEHLSSQPEMQNKTFLDLWAILKENRIV